MKKIKTETGGMKIICSEKPKERNILTENNLKVGDQIKVYAKINKYRWYKGEVESFGATWLTLRQTKRILDFNHDDIKEILRITSDDKTSQLLSEKLKKDKVVYLDDYKLGGGLYH